MTSKTFFIIILTIGVLVGGFYVLNNHIYNEKQSPVTATETLEDTPREAPIFTWSFKPANSLNGDGNPNTDVFVEAKYSDGEIVKKLVDTSHGGCNQLPDSDNVQCYGAGLGFNYRITKGEKSYLIERQEFEEGSPDYNPPVQDYKVIAEFSF
ncbi:MAG: hypothetical protein QG551_202 [Patescibacteria group bacterium]|jgi:hypothetical protein|nr:hypothetical protein [Patescibacteria group bacterium]